jgi:hypothetical protein
MNALRKAGLGSAPSSQCNRGPSSHRRFRADQRALAAVQIAVIAGLSYTAARCGPHSQCLFLEYDMENGKPAMQRDPALAKNAGEFLIGGDLRVTRLGFGAMRITGDGIWGAPSNRAEAVRVSRRAVELIESDL